MYFFFFNDTATTEIYTLSLHDALPISGSRACLRSRPEGRPGVRRKPRIARRRVVPKPTGSEDRKSTRLNSSHANISYAVFCLKKTTTHPTFLSRAFYNTFPLTLLFPTP